MKEKRSLFSKASAGRWQQVWFKIQQWKIFNEKNKYIQENINAEYETKYPKSQKRRFKLYTRLIKNLQAKLLNIIVSRN